MGYCITQKDTKFEILRKNKDLALQLLKQYAHKNKTISWVNNNNTILQSENLYDALCECRYEITEDEYGNVSNIEFTGEKLGDDKEIFNAIAPAVKNDSYIEMMGENGLQWQWIFKNGKCYEKLAETSWA